MPSIEPRKNKAYTHGTVRNNQYALKTLANNTYKIIRVLVFNPRVYVYLQGRQTF